MTFRATSLTEQLLRVTESNDFGWRLRAHWANALKDDLVGSGVDPTSVVIDARFGFDGGYGFGRQHWDLVVFDNDLPVALVEIKTILNSVRKNLANRMEEIIAIATNLARVFDGPGQAAYKPCVAVVFAIEATDAAGDIERVGEAFSRMLEDRLLDAACLLSVDRNKRVVSEPFENQNFDSFVGAILRYINDVTAQRGHGATGAASFGRALAHSDDIEAVVSGLTSTREGLSAAEAAVIRERRRLVSDLRQLALDPGANETKMQAAIEGHYWLFGGQYVGIAERRTFVPLDQYDVPLICADGSIEIVELKGPEAQLVRQHRKHLIASNQVHEAVNQCLNYLRALDEVGAALQTHYRNELNLELDFRRARGTVIIGHPGRTSTGGVTKEQVDQTIRSYNAHLSRLTVRTYADVLDSAERSLRFASEGTTAGQAESGN